MKFLTAVILSAFSLGVFAQNGEMFTKAKEHILSNLDKRISWLQEQKTCTAAATDQAGIKACRDAHQAKVQTLKGENESFKSGMKAEKMGRKKKN